MPRTLSASQLFAMSGPLKALRAGPRLLIFDFDGTLAPLAATPEQARLSPAAKRALRRLQRLPGVVVAVLSGRSLESLRRLLPHGPVLVGNHGLRASVPGLGVSSEKLAPYKRAVTKQLPALRLLAAAVPGALVEAKVCDVSLHYRAVARPQVAPLLEAARSLFHGSGLRSREGKKVLEFGPPLRRGKASGLLHLAQRLAPGWRKNGACLFIGDDRTDEDAFLAARTLGPRMITIKVGPGPSAATWRLGRREGVDRLLRSLADHANEE